MWKLTCACRHRSKLKLSCFPHMGLELKQYSISTNNVIGISTVANFAHRVCHHLAAVFPYLTFRTPRRREIFRDLLHQALDVYLHLSRSPDGPTLADFIVTFWLGPSPAMLDLCTCHRTDPLRSFGMHSVGHFGKEIFGQRHQKEAVAHIGSRLYTVADWRRYSR